MYGKTTFKALLLLWAILCSSVINAQSVGINTTGAAPNSSSMLDVSSTNSGFLPPRMTILQRNAIPTPAIGLMIYNLDCLDINVYNGTSWVSIMTPGPTILPPTGVSGTQFTANWSNNGGTAYYLDVSTNPMFSSFVAGFNNLNVGVVTTYNVTGLTCGVPYYYRVRSSSACGMSANSGIQTSTGPCCISNYSVMSIPFAPVAGAGTAVALTDDSESAALPIGFTFSFYCTNYTNFYISSNGFIEFAVGGNGCCSGQCLPNVTTPNNLIAFSWTDLNPGSGGTINYQTVGSAPNRKLIVRFNAVPHYVSGNNITTQVILYETTNQIEIHTTTMPTNGNLHTMGVENAAGTIATTVTGRSCSSWSATNEAYRFY